VTLGLRFAIRSDVGLLREGNEDAAYAGPRLLAVADGMGGHAAGEVASRVAIQTVATLDAEPDPPDALAALRDALEGAQREIRERVAGDESLAGMGTTLTALLWTGGGLGLLHVGDSRAYLLRDGELRQITHDHTFVQELVDAGQLTEDEASVHPQRALLTRALDGRSVAEPDLAIREVRLGDRYLLCTDGLSGVVRAETLRESLLIADAGAAADRLVALALRGGGPDNITVVVCDVVQDGEPPAGPTVVGAAAGADGPPATGPATAEHTLTGGSGEQTSSGEVRAARPRSRPVLVALAVTLGLLAIAAGGWFWLRSQYFVGVEGDHVAIFRGVAWSIGGLHMHSVAEQLALDPADLPQFERERLEDGIIAPNLPQARQVAARLVTERCVAPAPTTAPPPTIPSPAPATSTPCPAPQP